MEEQKKIAFRAPISPDVLTDPALFAALVGMLLAGVRLEATRACEGRAFTVYGATLRIRPYDPPFITEESPLYLRDMLWAILELIITPDSP
jgi:hypothetical protein